MADTHWLLPLPYVNCIAMVNRKRQPRFIFALSHSLTYEQATHAVAGGVNQQHTIARTEPFGTTFNEVLFSLDTPLGRMSS